MAKIRRNGVSEWLSNKELCPEKARLTIFSPRTNILKMASSLESAARIQPYSPHTRWKLPGRELLQDDPSWQSRFGLIFDLSLVIDQYNRSAILFYSTSQPELSFICGVDIYRELGITHHIPSLIKMIKFLFKTYHRALWIDVLALFSWSLGELLCKFIWEIKPLAYSRLCSNCHDSCARILLVLCMQDDRPEAGKQHFLIDNSAILHSVAYQLKSLAEDEVPRMNKQHLTKEDYRDHMLLIGSLSKPLLTSVAEPSYPSTAGLRSYLANSRLVDLCPSIIQTAIEENNRIPQRQIDFMIEYTSKLTFPGLHL